MKTVSKMGKAFGGLVLLLAIMAFITAVSLFVVGGFLAMWPVLRLSPRGQRKQAVANLLASLMACAIVFRTQEDDDEENELAPKSA